MNDIRNYTSFFHDGSITKIEHSANKLIMTMESAEMDEEDINNDITLSTDDRIRGKLHIDGIKSIRENGSQKIEKLEMKYPDAGIAHLKIQSDKVLFEIKWNSSPPQPSIKDFSAIEIIAEKICWENMPDLEI